MPRMNRDTMTFIKEREPDDDFVLRAAPGTQGKFTARLARLPDGSVGVSVFGKVWRAPKGLMRQLVYARVGDVLEVETTCNEDGSGRTWTVR